MRRLAVVAAVALGGVGAGAVLHAWARAAQAGDPPPAASSCTSNCHGEESTAHAASVHARTLACTDCHGGDAAADRDKARAHDAAKGFVGKIAREKIPSLCGDCHSDTLKMAPYGLPTDQLAHYKTSNHGKALFEKGDTTVAVCTDCHSAHAILPPKDPRARTSGFNQPETCGKCHSDAVKMGAHGISADTVEQFRQSVHGKALLLDRARGAPSCSDCHGSHGAAPPGVRAVAQVCGSCHVNTEEHYSKGPHGRAGATMACRTCHEKEKGGQYSRGGCGACHDPHAVVHPDESMLKGSEVGHCGHCHRQAEPAVEAFTKTLVDGSRRLEESMKETKARVDRAKANSLFIEGEEVYLRESERIFVSVRPLSHSLDRAAVEAKLHDGVQRQERTVETIDKKAEVVRDRKIMMAAIAFLLLLLEALLLVKLDAVRRLS